MAEYTGTADPNEVNKSTTNTTTLIISNGVDKYLELEDRWTNRIRAKTVPDQETLDYWNESFVEDEEAAIRAEAQVLYDELWPIYQAGLLPPQYEDELLRLKLFLGL